LTVFAQRYWIWIWYGILALGVIGLVPALHWGRRTNWKNLDEVLRGIGTICTSVGMLLLLSQAVIPLAYTLLGTSLAAFVGAFVWGRRLESQRKKQAPTA
jgi:hypothetical protein